MQKLLGVWLAASAETAVLQDVLMNERHFSAMSVKICYDLTAGTRWLSGVRGAWVTFPDELFVEVTGIDFPPVCAVIKHRAYLRGSDNLDPFTSHV